MSSFVYRTTGNRNRLRVRLEQRIAVAAATFLMLASTSMPANAAPQWCAGTMANLYISSNGDVNAAVSWLGGTYVRFCNLNQTLGAVTPMNCAAWVSLMRSAVQRGAQTTVYYGDAPVCNAIPSYASAPVPDYVMLMN